MSEKISLLLAIYSPMLGLLGVPFAAAGSTLGRTIAMGSAAAAVACLTGSLVVGLRQVLRRRLERPGLLTLALVLDAAWIAGLALMAWQTW